MTLSKFEDTKGVIRSQKSKKDRQHNGQKKKDKRTNKDLQQHYTETYYFVEKKINRINNTVLLAKYIHFFI